ncbi:hypothetical protein BGZ52_003270, partial [Haplosporangium bisporale]
MDKILHLGKKRSTKHSPPISISSPTPSPAGSSPFFPTNSPPFVPQTTYQPRASLNLSPGDHSQYLGGSNHNGHQSYASSSSGSTYTNNSPSQHHHSSDHSSISSGRTYATSSNPYFGSVSGAAASVISTLTSGHHRGSSGERPTSPSNNFDTMSIRSFRTSTSGTASEAGRTEAMSLARPRNDQEIEDRFVDFMNNMGMHEPEKRKAMAQLPMDTKWKLIYQHESQEQSK